MQGLLDFYLLITGSYAEKFTFLSTEKEERREGFSPRFESKRSTAIGLWTALSTVSRYLIQSFLKIVNAGRRIRTFVGTKPQDFSSSSFLGGP